MIKTFIYGTPNGFDFYEQETASKELSDYFKGFYISSRKDRGLMVNRRENGITTYNYLRYGLVEVIGRPNSFFGMTLLLDENQYCPDFKKIFDWFDYMFGKLLEQNTILYTNDGGTVQYRISKFHEVKESVEWIKSNLPNIFSAAAGTLIDNYDFSFSSALTGKVACFNDLEKQANLLAAFKTYRWVAISPIFEKSMELEHGELEEKLNSLNKDLFLISTGVKEVSIATLESWEQESTDICEDITKYLHTTILDSEEKESFEKLFNDYQSLKKGLSVLLQKVKKPIVEEPSTEFVQLKETELTKTCKCCGKEKPLSQFHSPSESTCILCEENVRNHYTKDKKNERQVVNPFKENGNQIKHLKQFIPHGIVAVLLALIVIIYFSMPNSEPTQPTSRKEVNERVENVTTPQKQKVDVRRFNEYLNNKLFKEAYECIKDKVDANNYINLLREAVVDHLWHMIDDGTSNRNKEDVKADIIEFHIMHKLMLEDINTLKEAEWKELTDDYYKLWDIIRKSSSLDENDHNTADKIISKYTDAPFYKYLKNIKEAIDIKWNIRVIPKVKTIEAHASPQITLEKLKSDGKTLIGTPIAIDRTCGYELNVGEYVVIKYNGASLSIPDNSIYQNNSKPKEGWLRIKITKAGSSIYIVGDIEITITGKTQFKKR